MTNLGQDEDRKRTYEGPHRQEVQFFRKLTVKSDLVLSLRYMYIFTALRVCNHLLDMIYNRENVRW